MRGSVCALRNIVEIHIYYIDLHKYIINKINCYLYVNRLTMKRMR